MAGYDTQGLEVEEAPGIAVAGAERARQKHQVFAVLGVSAAFILVLVIGIVVGHKIASDKFSIAPKTAPDASQDVEDKHLVVIKGRDENCRPDDIWAKDSVPKTIHIVAKQCNTNLRRGVWANIQGVDLSCFEIRCYSNTYKEAYVRKFFPEWADFYMSLPMPVMQADIIRYLILYNEGGFYMDDDVDVLPGFSVSFERMRKESLIVGWERRGGEPIGTWCGAKTTGMLCNSLANFAIGARAGTKALLDVVRSSEEFFRVTKTTGSSFQDVLQGTGPVRFSNVVLSQLSADKVQFIDAFGCRFGSCNRADFRMWLHHRFEGKWKA